MPSSNIAKAAWFYFARLQLHVSTLQGYITGAQFKPYILDVCYKWNITLSLACIDKARICYIVNAIYAWALMAVVNFKHHSHSSVAMLKL